MSKRNRIIIISLFSILLLISCIFFIPKTSTKEKTTTNITKNPIVEDSSIKDSPSGSDTYEESSNSDVITNADGSTNVNIPSSSENNTTSHSSTNVEDMTDTNNMTDTEDMTTSRNPIGSNNPPILEEIQIPEESEAPTNSNFRISLTAPDAVQVNTPFTLSIDTTNCIHIEWYINGTYHPELASQIQPSGTLKFSASGIYRITVIGYTEDWSENVSYTKSVRVYDDLSQMNGNAKEHDRAMYSWNHDYIYESNEAILQKVMELTECNILYQEISSNASASDVAAFLQRRGEHNQTVYYLCGNASWGIESGATSMLKQVERAVAYNNSSGTYKFVGIQFDVEPYCLADFEENADEYMAQYLENCKLAYAAAHEAGLLVEICIPYWWDSAYGYYDQLEDLIANACDSVAVMNYYKKQKEASHIETEVELCKRYNKKIINITETIPPGLHGLTENNTYYNDGIDAIEDMWNTLDGYFQYEKLGYSYHYLDVIIELLSLN